MKNFKNIIIIFSIITFMFVAYVIFSGFFEPKVYNLMVRNITANKHGSSDIVVIVIDDKSIARYRWPWKRDLYAKIFEYLNSYANARLVGFDAIIATPDAENPLADKYLFDMIKANNNLVVGFSPLSSVYKNPKLGEAYDEKFKNKYAITPTDKRLGAKGKRFKSLSMYPEAYFNSVQKNGSVWVLPNAVDGYVKDIPQIIDYKGSLYPSLAMRMYLELNNIKDFSLDSNSINISESIHFSSHLRNGGIFNLLHFYKLLPNSDYSHQYFSAVDLIDSLDAIKQGKKPIINPNIFNNKIVIVGANAKAAALGLEDALPTPVHNNHPGVDIQATNLDNLMHNEFLSSVTPIQELLINILFIIATFIIVSFYSLSVSLGVVSLIIIAYIIFCSLLFALNVAIPVMTPISLQLITMIFAYSYKFIKESRSKEKIKVAMGKYISQDIMQNVVKHIDEVKLGGKKANVTVLFADIRGFTSMSEKLAPEEISLILNEYFTEIEPIITKYNGVINKFIGDAVMAIFGEPIQDKTHATNAVKCADEMLKKVEELQQKWLKEGKPKIEIGVGINTGEAFVGNIGSETRMEYTVIGDMVNLASRIESFNKVYKTQFLISSTTYDCVRGLADVIKISEVTIRGKSKKMTIYEVLRLV